MRITHLSTILALLSLAGATQPGAAQAKGAGSDYTVERFDLAAGYEYVRTNAPPEDCQCFGMTTVFGSGSYHLRNWLAVDGQVTWGHANNISGLGQNLTLLTFGGGPRLSWPVHRVTPFVRGLFGNARASDSYFPTATGYTSNASSFMYDVGGGIDYSYNHRLSIRFLQLSYTRTSFPNGVDNEQAHLGIGAGIVVKFGGRQPEPRPTPITAMAPVERKPWGELSFSCSTSVAAIERGLPLEIVGNSATRPDQLDVSYNWTASGGTVEGSGRSITVNTTDMSPGTYHVTGHASLAGNDGVHSSCDVAFRVVAPLAAEEPVVASASTGGRKAMAVGAAKDGDFHDNVRDVYFDYDKANIRNDALQSILRAAVYLKTHPEMEVLLSGHADERGTTPHNLELGVKRAESVRDALIAAGIEASRFQIVSYGNTKQVCTAENETCWQQNRRVAFYPHP